MVKERFELGNVVTVDYEGAQYSKCVIVDILVEDDGVTPASYKVFNRSRGLTFEVMADGSEVMKRCPDYTHEQRVQVEADILNDRLCDACETGDYDAVWDALEDGAGVACRGNEPIQLAEDNGHLDIVSHLIHLGAELPKKEVNDSTFSAKGRKNVEAIIEILNKQSISKERKHQDLAEALFTLYKDAKAEGLAQRTST